MSAYMVASGSFVALFEVSNFFFSFDVVNIYLCRLRWFFVSISTWRSIFVNATGSVS